MSAAVQEAAGQPQSTSWAAVSPAGPWQLPGSAGKVLGGLRGQGLSCPQLPAPAAVQHCDTCPKAAVMCHRASPGCSGAEPAPGVCIPIAWEASYLSFWILNRVFVKTTMRKTVKYFHTSASPSVSCYRCLFLNVLGVLFVVSSCWDVPCTELAIAQQCGEAEGGGGCCGFSVLLFTLCPDRSGVLIFICKKQWPAGSAGESWASLVSQNSDIWK